MATLKQGSSGAKVKALQQKLKELGFDPKGVDGNFGPGTKAAVIAFQKSKGLKADGVAGPATLAALKASGSAVGITSPSSPSPSPSPTSTSTATTPGAGGALNLAGLKGHLPDAVIAQIPETAQKFGITSNLRLAHFLAQCALESTGFKATEENLNYSAPRLRQIFPKYFRTVDPAAYAHNPQKIGSRVYANRMGNGNEASGDGFKFRGRGYIQLTGKSNYTSFSNFVGEDCVANPDLVATKYPLASAAFFFDSNKIFAICDQGANDLTVRRVTKAVNGGTHGLVERIRNFKKFRQALA